MNKITSRVALLGAVGAALSVAAAFLATHDAKAQSEDKAVAAEKAPEASAGMVIAIDPATGKIRTPEPSEIIALQSAPTTKKASESKAPETFALPGGGVGMMLDKSFDCAALAVQTPDKKVKFDCVVGEENAAAVAQAKESKKTERLDEK